MVAWYVHSLLACSSLSAGFMHESVRQIITAWQSHPTSQSLRTQLLETSKREFANQLNQRHNIRYLKILTNNRNSASLPLLMSMQGSPAGLEVFEALNIENENAYASNEIKKSCITHAISLLHPSSKVLDVGCGTSIPVSSMLSKANLFVVAGDLSFFPFPQKGPRN
ncbi:hypothetical protein BKA61DRAFT_301403 [Leptodontidium sp. MPI-SDFR-AT-0119]|nr:hypothetical protein BKA61DRAFT_301403 [Leptodontidium sp. MPI-SDFR-AT-0119]